MELEQNRNSADVQSFARVPVERWNFEKVRMSLHVILWTPPSTVNINTLVPAIRPQLSTYYKIYQIMRNTSVK